MLHGLCLGRKPEHETLRFLCIVAAAGDERYLLCEGGTAAIVSGVIGSSSKFCSECLSMFAYALVESQVAKRIVMAA